jgi:hypothetical protein
MGTTTVHDHLRTHPDRLRVTLWPLPWPAPLLRELRGRGPAAPSSMSEPARDLVLGPANVQESAQEWRR